MPKYDTPVSDRHVFPVYNTPELYKAATGEDAPPFVAALKPKYWFDPKAREVAKTEPMAEFEYTAVAIKDGKPVLKVITLEAIDAGAVNIPGLADTILDNHGVPIQRSKVLDPVKPMLPGEELALTPMMGIPVFRNMAEYIKGLEAVDAFLAADREEMNAKLDRIVAKLGA